MPWADETRCLFCDGKLPLYRKLTQGQFCSKQHQDAYWKEQNQLAVEVLHRTHDAIQAFKATIPEEDILGPPPAPPPPVSDDPWWLVKDEPVVQAAPEPEPEPEPTFSWAIHKVEPHIVERTAPPEPAEPPVRAPEPEGDYSFSYALPVIEEIQAPELPLPDVADVLGLVPQAAHIDPAIHDVTMMASDPVEYETSLEIETPFFAFQPLAVEIHNDPEDLAGHVPLLALLAAVCELPLPAGELDPHEAEIQVEAPLLDVAFRASLPEANKVPFDAARMAHSPWPSAPVAPLDFTAPAARLAKSDLVPCGDVIDRMERQAFPFSESVFGLAAPHPRTMAAAAATGAESFHEFTAVALHQPAHQWAAPVVHGLSTSTDLEALPAEFAPRAWTSGVISRPDHVEARPQAVALPAADITIGHDPAMAGLVRMSAAAPRSETTGYRAVWFQPFTPTGSVERPAAATPAIPHVFSPRLHANVFRLNLLGKLRPRACHLPLRGTLPPVFEPGEPLFPKARLEVRSWRTPLGQAAAIASLLPEVATRLPRNLLSGAAHFWNHAPRDLKILLFAVPLALGLAFAPSLPKVSTKAPDAPAGEVSGFSQMVSNQWGSMRKAMADRAAVGLDENFRHGLDSWQAIDGSTAEWSFDQAGFVVPGRVALYKPSMTLKDYEMQFLGAVDQKSLSWVVRAVDFQNFYVVKLNVLRKGPVPKLSVTRYAVINGKSVDREDPPVAIDTQLDSFYRIGMTVEGDNFSLVIQGRQIDSWKEPRLKHGGVGFFTDRGEQSRIGWVQITHQYDMLGRLFAYLAP
jgi:hypothetical protein